MYLREVADAIEEGFFDLDGSQKAEDIRGGRSIEVHGKGELMGSEVNVFFRASVNGGDASSFLSSV